MDPAELAEAAQSLASRHGAAFNTIVGDDLLKQNFPLIHAVGRAAARAPRLIDFTWGDPAAPKITLVGKGVCFDTGGLDIKSDAGMLNMKKDMGGAACMLAAAHMIMDAKLKVRLRVLIPAVENAISGDAFRPLDIYRSRLGLTVEIGNTDAEGRLVLADALALADEEAPELIADMATLTGAARVALGPELPPLFTHDDTLAADLARHGHAERDPMWRLPLWRPYESLLDSKTADINNVGGPQAGAITAALFLNRFVTAAKAWAHFDIFAWTPSAKPARPDGGECQIARALYALLKERTPTSSGRREGPRRVGSRMRSTCALRLKQFGPETISVDTMAVEMRPSQALKLLQDFSLTLVTDGEADLSARQLAILLTIYLEPPPHTVRGLAAKLKVTKPVITRALDTMGKLGLVSRRRDETDRRNVVIQRTPKGALAVERLGDVLIGKARELPR